MKIIKKNNPVISCILLFCFVVVFSAQVSFDIEEAAAMNVRLMKSTAGFFRSEILRPYLSVFITTDLVSAGSSAAEAGREKTPANEKQRNNNFTNILSVLMNIIATGAYAVLILTLSLLPSTLITAPDSAAPEARAYITRWLNSFCRKIIIKLNIFIFYDKLKAHYWNIVSKGEPRVCRNSAVF